MKDKIKAKLDSHIDSILAKDTITNEDYYLLNILYQKIEADEKIAETQAKMEEEKAKSREKMQALVDGLF